MNARHCGHQTKVELVVGLHPNDAGYRPATYGHCKKLGPATSTTPFTNSTRQRIAESLSELGSTMKCHRTGKLSMGSMPVPHT